MTHGLPTSGKETSNSTRLDNQSEQSAKVILIVFDWWEGVEEWIAGRGKM